MVNFQQSQVHELLHPLLFFLAGVGSVYFVTKWLLKAPSSNKRVPPSPPKIPILGNLHQLSPLTHHSFVSLGAKYGPNMLLHFGNKPVFIFQSPDAVTEVLKTHDSIFANKPTTSTIKTLMYDFKDIAMAPYGEHWRKMKSICIVQLLSSKKVQDLSSIREEETTLLLKYIGSCSTSGLPVNLSGSFFTLTNDVLCRSAFGKKYSEGEAGKNFLVLVKELLQLIGSPKIGEFIPFLSWINWFNGFDAKVDKVAKEIDDFLERVVEEHMNPGRESGGDEKGNETFIDILLHVYKENATGVSIDRDNIKGIILDLFAGGTDTTAATLNWTMAELLRHPIVMKKLQTEVRGILKDKECISKDDLEKMHYLKAVVKESLRCHVPLPLMGREPREDVKVMGYDIPAGSMILINNWALCNDPLSWEEPEKFTTREHSFRDRFFKTEKNLSLILTN